MYPKRLLDQFLGGGVNNSPNTAGSSGFLPAGLQGIGGVSGGLAAGGILGLLLGNKKARKTMGKMAGGAIGLGGAAALGALAYRAYSNWQGNSTTAKSGEAKRPAGSIVFGPAAESAFDPGAAPASDDRPFEIALIKAMIAAINADRHIDAEEQRTIFDTVAGMPLDAQDKALVFDTLRNPPSIDDIAALACGPEQAAELYLASRLAIDPDHPSERAYLESLASRLSLPGDLVTELNDQVLTRKAITT